MNNYWGNRHPSFWCDTDCGCGGRQPAAYCEAAEHCSACRIYFQAHLEPVEGELQANPGLSYFFDRVFNMFALVVVLGAVFYLGAHLLARQICGG